MNLRRFDETRWLARARVMLGDLRRGPAADVDDTGGQRAVTVPTNGPALVVMAAAAALLAAAAIATVHGQPANAFRASRDHPAIAYSTGPVDNAVVELNRRLRNGEAQLAFNDRSGYLRSVLDLLDIPVESQVTVFSPTSNQANLINSTNPRAVYFRDDVAVGWVRGGGKLEAAVQDLRQGTIFYALDQAPDGARQFVRDDQCLACHLTWETLGVPGLQVLSTFPLTSDPNAYATGFVSDHRARIEDRWGGWYVTGRHAPFAHMGNVEVTDVEDPNATIGVPRPELPSLEGLFDLSGYPSAHSDIAALMVLEHQTHMTNLITRVGWEARRILFRDNGAGGQPADDGPGSILHDAVVDMVDYLLFVDEAPLARPVQGSSAFAAAFPARGPHDRLGRSLRDLDLQRGLMRYPCSYMIYTAAFDALPEPALEAIYRRIWSILSGEESGRPYDRLSADDRQAVIEILVDTKPGLPGFFR